MENLAGFTSCYTFSRYFSSRSITTSRLSRRS